MGKAVPDTRTVLVKAQLPNPEGRLKPGMLANLDVILTVREQAVVIPLVYTLFSYLRALFRQKPEPLEAAAAPKLVGRW